GQSHPQFPRGIPQRDRSVLPTTLGPFSRVVDPGQTLRRIPQRTGTLRTTERSYLDLMRLRTLLGLPASSSAPVSEARTSTCTRSLPRLGGRRPQTSNSCDETEPRAKGVLRA